jgi:protein involved in polysaccharide export with SLBB domain
MSPAIYEMNRETRLLDMISMSGGLTNIAFKGRIQVWRIEDRQYRSIFEGDLIEIDKNSSKNFMLKDGDLIKIYPIFEVKNIIFLSGAVASPGEFAVKPGVTKIQDVINQSGGLLYFASNQAEITRVKVTQEGPQTERIMIDVSKALTGDPKHNIQLESNDYIFIRTVPDWELFQKVSIHGEVRHPGTYTIKKGEKLSSLIKRAGGFSDKAYLRGAKFFRESVRSIQQKQTDEMADRLEREVIGLGTTEVAVALSPEEAQIKEYELKQKREFVKHIKSMRATGRLVLKIDQPDILSKTPFDLELEEGDSLFIPTNPGSVQVIGSVYNQSAFIFDANQGVSSYVEMTGGATQYADTDKIFVLKVDGTAIKPGGGLFSLAWSRNTRQWESGSRELEPGDTIVVPEKLEKTPWMRDIKDITQILYQIAVGVGVMFVAF